MRRCSLLGLAVSFSCAWGDIHLSVKEEYSQEQANTYCRELGEGWRGMSITEIYALPKTTPFVEGYSYWSSSTITSGTAVIGTGSEGDGGIMEVIGFAFYPKERNVTFSPRWKKIAAICTNDPLPPKRVRHYKKVPEGTLDEERGLIWLDLGATDKKARYTHDEAKEICENLSLFNRSWRLPSTDELYSIVDYDFVRPTIDMKYFGPVMQRYYWTSDTLNENFAFVVGFKLGSVATVSMKEDVYTRCVTELE